MKAIFDEDPMADVHEAIIAAVTAARVPSSLQKRSPALLSRMPPLPRIASGASIFEVLLGSLGFTRPVGCTCTWARSDEETES